MTTEESALPGREQAAAAEMRRLLSTAAAECNELAAENESLRASVASLTETVAQQQKRVAELSSPSGLFRAVARRLRRGLNGDA